MALYLADLETEDGTVGQIYNADSMAGAEMIAVENGWDFVGELIESVELTESQFAMITDSLTPDTVH